MKRLRVLPELLLAARENETMLNYPDGSDGWEHYSTEKVRSTVEALALGLLEEGLEPGEPVGLIAPPSPDWIIADLAIQSAGGVTVPIFKRISPESYTHEIKDSGLERLFVGNPDEIPMAMEHAGEKVQIITFGCCSDNDRYREILEKGRGRAEKNPGEWEERIGEVTEDGLATIIYTSGSTGLPKGVELTQRNIASQIEACSTIFSFDPDKERILSALPLAHIFERMVVYFYLAQGLSIYFVDDPKQLGEQVRKIKPTAMTVVPRIMEKVYDKMRAKSAQMSGLKGVIARSAVRRAERRDPENPTWSLFDPLYEKAVYPTLREGLGGKLHTVISGSAKLSPDICRFFINIGVPVYEGYGMTEASPVIAVNHPKKRKVGSVGPILPGVEVRISSDGEILARGPNIMRGYHNRPDATAETITEDGWLKTGDVGSLDEEGFLTITARKKEIFKKSTGEYVPPAPIEHALSRHTLVETAVIFADNRAYVTALLFPDMEKVRQQAGEAGLSAGEYLESEAVQGSLREHVEEVNSHRHHCERVERFRIVDHPASVDSGELTPTLKVRREVVGQRYEELIEEMYESIHGWK
ncbi:MAG: AMP-dependent synthetase/ligase [Spirochaetaceae bacterium]